MMGPFEDWNNVDSACVCLHVELGLELAAAVVERVDDLLNDVFELEEVMEYIFFGAAETGFSMVGSW